MIIVRGCAFPADRHYHVQHNLWVAMQETGIATLGATSWGVAQAVEFIAFIPKPAGMHIEGDRALGLLEIAKTVSSVRAPGACEIVASNKSAVSDPSIINRDPYGDGWLLQLRFDDWEGVMSGLVTGDDIAQAYEEAMRLDGFEGIG